MEPPGIISVRFEKKPSARSRKLKRLTKKQKVGVVVGVIVVVVVVVVVVRSSRF